MGLEIAFIEWQWMIFSLFMFHTKVVGAQNRFDRQFQRVCTVYFLSQNKKNNEYLCKPHISLYYMGFSGVFISWTYIYSEIPLILRPPKIKTSYLLKTLFA